MHVKLCEDAWPFHIFLSKFVLLEKKLIGIETLRALLVPQSVSIAHGHTIFLRPLPVMDGMWLIIL